MNPALPLCETPIFYKKVTNAASGVTYGNSTFVATRGQARIEGGVVAGHDQDPGYPRIEESLDGINVSNVIVIPKVVNPFQPAGESCYPVNVRTQAPYARFRTLYTDAGTPTTDLAVRVQARPDGAFST